jgi:hypothetical protein
MENQNEVTVVPTREVSYDLYGAWFGKNLTPADIVCWCDKQIKKCEEWIKNCEELKFKNQQKLLKDIPEDVLKAALASRTDSSSTTE